MIKGEKELDIDIRSETNRTFDQIEVGESATFIRTLETRDLKAWESATGEQVLSGEGGIGIIVALLSGLASSRLPGPGTVVKSIKIDLTRPIIAGDIIEVKLIIKEKDVSSQSVVLDVVCKHACHEIIATGTLHVQAPKKSVVLKPSHSLDELLDLCKRLSPITTGVIWPLSETSLIGAIESPDLISPVLYGPQKGIEALAKKINIDLNKIKVVDSTNPEEASFKAASDAGNGKLQALMKGSLHTNIILHAILENETKLKTGRLLSHCALISAPTYPERIILSDVALNIAPNIDQKLDICQNAIGFAHAVGIKQPRVAILSAIEMVNTKMPSTVDAAVLAKMGNRGQIEGAIIDGPLDLDAAIDIQAANIKNIQSPIAGIANVLIVPNIEAGNMVYKQFAFMSDAQTAGLIVGARVPVILTSRADTPKNRRFSAAVAVLYSNALAKDPLTILGETKD